MDRATFNIWMDEMYEGQGLFRIESDVEYDFLTMDEEESTEWLVDQEDKARWRPSASSRD